MWGNIITDLSYQTNYWFGFPNSNSDVVIGLTMWQYWWWFWFTYYMCLYYFIFLRLIRHRTLKFSPKVVTSQKSHGKWGDFIICVVPVSWCANILSNSNFIMRMLEWQTESSLFTVRIRGRQWYWVYKIELKDLLKASTTAKNIGHDYWEVFENIDAAQTAENLNSLQIKNHNKEYLDAYKKNLISLYHRNMTYSTAIYSSVYSNTDVTPHNTAYSYDFEGSAVPPITSFPKDRVAFLSNSEKVLTDIRSSDITANRVLKIEKNAFNYNKRFARAHNFTLPQHTTYIKSNRLTWTDSSAMFEPKTTADNLYFVIKQKRFAAPIKKINSINIAATGKQLQLKNFSTLVHLSEHNYTRKWTAKRLKYKSSVIPLTYNRRLLRTRRVLVLPSQVNITLITNSFDVVHSWYIPGLGVKLDCIPGRSTHHTIFIDHAGFYYGQCAEICGRYHHHMPIRVCALPFEHFLVWWYHYGLPYFNATSVDRKTSVKAGIRQYSW